jgi:hypothetical protein
VDSSRLTAEQIEKMRAVLSRQSRYLHSVIYRMVDLKWRTNDPLWTSTHKACAAVDELLGKLVVRRRPGGRLQPESLIANASRRVHLFRVHSASAG